MVTTMHDSHFYCVTIQDFGKGMARKEQQKFLRYFYTTKNKGMGLGLLIVKGIIDKHNGKIDIKITLCGKEILILWIKKLKY